MALKQSLPPKSAKTRGQTGPGPLASRPFRERERATDSKAGAPDGERAELLGHHLGRLTAAARQPLSSPLQAQTDLSRVAEGAGALVAPSLSLLPRPDPIGALSTGRPAGSAPIQRVGEQKKDFIYAATKDSTEYDAGAKMLAEALAAMKIARRAEKEKLFQSGVTAKKKKGGKTVSEIYGGGLGKIDDLALLKATKHFQSGPPALSIESNTVQYQSTKQAKPVRIADIKDRVYKKAVKQPKEAKRDVYRGADPDKDYVKDSRDVMTRRYAYVEKNYWQLMEFLTKNKLEGRYQTFFRAANEGVERPAIDTARKKQAQKVKKGRIKASNPKLTSEQLAVLHQWKGSGLQQRGLSLTSTSKVGKTIGNSGDNFRTEVGVRLKIDLAKIPTDEDGPVLLNHYAKGGVKDSLTGVKKINYDYLNSVLKNRELFLEFLDPDWIVSIEYHTQGGKKEFDRDPKGSADELMDEARKETNYGRFSAGFEKGMTIKGQVKTSTLKTTEQSDSDFVAGVEFANEYKKGRAQGLKDGAVKGKNVNPLEKGGLDPGRWKDIFAIGRIHGRRGRKAGTLAEVWS